MPCATLDQPDLAEPVASAIAQIDGSIANLRNLIADLRPAALDALGAGAAIETLVAHLGSRTNIEIELASIDLAYERGIEPTRQVPEIEATLYRITQEALNNVLKHSNATTATVSVVEEDGTITLTIRDDGVGFDQSKQSTGFGLIGMRERVALVDGSISIKAAPGLGTTVEVAIPVRRVSSESERPQLADVELDAPAAS